jgi:NADH:ubiquinone reductase (H+-translocating)
MAVSSDSKPRVVIVGAGFAGLYAARALRRAPVRVTVIDRKNHHLFQPLLYQVASAGLNPGDIALPIRSILRHNENTEVILGNVRAIDRSLRKVLLEDGEIEYDFLIVATGATHSYFGHPEWAKHAPGLKTIEDAVEIRRRILLAYEAAERESDPAIREALLTFVVIGAGPTGVELAGALSEIARYSMVKDFRHIDPTDARVLLMEAADRVLPPYPEDLSEKAKAQLEGLGVEVRTKTTVTDINAEGVCIGDEWIAARTVLWAAGVQASALAKSLDAPLDKAGRVEVEDDLTVPGDPYVFVVGDLALVKHGDTQVPGVASAAIQEGKHVASNIRRALEGRKYLPFHYRDKGSLATIGRAAAVADFGSMQLSGRMAWLAWLLVHVFFMIGFRNRLMVMIEWAFAYITHSRGSRLITGEVHRVVDPD